MLNSITNDIRKNIALAYKCKFDVPEMVVIDDNANMDHLLNNPHWHIEDNIALEIPSDIIFDYCLYYDNERGEFKNPVLIVNDNYLLSGQMGAILPANLVTAITLNDSIKIKQLNNLKQVIDEYDPEFNGFVTLRFSLKDKQLIYQKIIFNLIPDYYYNMINLYGIDTRIDDFKDRTPSGISVSARLYTYPYDTVLNKEVVKSFAEDYNLIELDECYLATYYSVKIHIKNTWSELYSILDNNYLKHAGVVYNTDGGLEARKTYILLQKSRFIK